MNKEVNIDVVRLIGMNIRKNLTISRNTLGYISIIYKYFQWLERSHTFLCM